MARLAHYRKALFAALGVAATLAATIPTDTPGWRWAQIIMALATVVGVYGVPNAPPVYHGPTREDLKRETIRPAGPGRAGPDDVPPTGNPYDKRYRPRKPPPSV